ncbi:MAG: class I SAM-dependent methyltransferase [Desulfobacterales bacterium]|nr:class I SAM-dependent methyltransferase [Desulfobacterales bacterium]
MDHRRLTPVNDANQQIRLCLICGYVGFKPYKVGLVQCEGCGVVLSPIIWEPQANEYLEEEWFGEDYRPKTSFWVVLFENWNNRNTLARLSKAKIAGQRLLEIGVGSGSFLNAARERGYEVMGCDLSGSICARVQRVHGIPMHNSPVAQIIHSAPFFDIVMMNHVLEHVQQPIEFLQDVRRLLVSGGVVHIAVPNVACWEALLPGWGSYEPYHLAYFSPQTLQRAVELAGFEVLRIRTHDSFSGWFLAILRTLLRANRKSAGERSAQREAAHLSWVGHAYHLAMVLGGVITLPLRLFQEVIGRGDEVVLIGRKAE